MGIGMRIAALFALLIAGTVNAQAPVRVDTVSERTIVRQINATGTVTSPRSAVLSTAVAGLVAELLVDEGYRVATGDEMLRLDAELAQLALERTIAAQHQRETELEDAKRRFAEAEKVAAKQHLNKV